MHSRARTSAAAAARATSATPNAPTLDATSDEQKPAVDLTPETSSTEPAQAAQGRRDLSILRRDRL
jgi:hypothetical protein